jgi:hypothetical protein
MNPLTQTELVPGVTVSASLGIENRSNPEDQAPFIALDWTEEADEEVGQTPRRLWLHLPELRPFIEFLLTTEKAIEEAKAKGRDRQ